MQTGGSDGSSPCLTGGISLPSAHLQSQLAMWPFLAVHSHLNRHLKPQWCTVIVQKYLGHYFINVIGSRLTQSIIISEISTLV